MKLSKSEALVLDLICVRGLTVREAAALRCRTLKTVSTQLCKAKLKLGATTSYHLGYLAGVYFKEESDRDQEVIACVVVPTTVHVGRCDVGHQSHGSV